MKSNQSELIKFIVSTLLAALLTYAIGIYGILPWWSFVLSNFIIAVLIVHKPWKSFLSGALGVGLLWLILAMIMDQQNQHILSVKVATILPLKGSSTALIALTGFVGFLLGGLSSLTGSFAKKLN
jgi:energy-coupling factor transporter transmembrane protein EcfT